MVSKTDSPLSYSYTNDSVPDVQLLKRKWYKLKVREKHEGIPTSR